MGSHGCRAPKHFKVPLGSKVRARRRQKPEEQSEPAELRLLRSPQLKAVSPYTPKSELEDCELRFLIYHYVNFVTARTVTNVGPRYEWYPLAVRDEAFFHALMSSTSSHAAYLQQVDLPRAFFYHRGEAIRQVNRRIASGAHDEGTICAVAVFGQQESFEGRPRTAKTHLDGLLTIVQKAGGINSPSLSEKTRRHIFLSDLSTCISVMSKPALPCRLDLSDLKQYFGQPDAATELYARNFGARLFNFTNSPLSDLATTVFWGLRGITTLLLAIHDGRESVETISPSDVQFTDRVEVLERLVHPLWYVEDPKTPQHPIFRTFGWACLIYIYTTLRELPKELGLNVLLASKIRTTLESYGDLNVLLATFQDLLLWQMFICGRVADSRDIAFFVRQASKILMVRKQEKKGGILMTVETFLWPEKQSESPEESDDVDYESDQILEDAAS